MIASLLTACASLFTAVSLLPDMPVRGAPGERVFERTLDGGMRLVVTATFLPYVKVTPAKRPSESTDNPLGEPGEVYELTYSIEQPDGKQLKLWSQRRKVYGSDVGEIVSPIWVLDATIQGEYLIAVYLVRGYPDNWFADAKIIHFHDSSPPHTVPGVSGTQIDRDMRVKAGRISGRLDHGDLRILLNGETRHIPPTFLRKSFKWKVSPEGGDWAEEEEQASSFVYASPLTIALQQTASAKTRIFITVLLLAILTAQIRSRNRQRGKSPGGSSLS